MAEDPDYPGGLDRYEFEVLSAVCKEGRYQSSVALTADLFGVAENVQVEREFEYLAVEQILQDLNKRGLVSYRLGAYGVVVGVKALSTAYALLGIERKWAHEVGHYWRPRQGGLHPGDMTDYRWHGLEAQGIGPCTHEDLIDHVAACDHAPKHLYQLIELYGSDKI